MKKPSMRKQIDLMCKRCIYDGSGGSGSWRQQVTDCTSSSCELYNLRPLVEGERHTWQMQVEKVNRSTEKAVFRTELDDFLGSPELPYGLTIIKP